MKRALEHTARKRDAVRILFILDKAGTRPGASAPEGAVAVLKAEKRLQALDFWVRCPDYLAAELMAMHEAWPEDGYLEEAFKVMQGDEPDVRRMHMMRFLFGAWEQPHRTAPIGGHPEQRFWCLTRRTFRAFSWSWVPERVKRTF